MTVVERLAEAIARGATRRSSLRSATALAFAGVAGLAAHGPSARAARCAVRLSEDAACNSPLGRFCDDAGVGGSCRGAACAGACTLDPTFYSQGVQSACWCTALEKEGRNRYAYWTCCDCQCANIAPGCVLLDDAGACVEIACREYDAEGNCLAPDRGCGCRERVSVSFEPAKRRPRR